MNEARHGQGPFLERLLLVLSSMSPLFVLWAIRGTDLMDERTFRLACAAMVVVPNAFLLFFLWMAVKDNAVRTIAVGTADDRRQDIISYLFAMLLPFYSADLTSWSNLAATIVAFLIIVVLFVSLNLQYMNFFVALLGYHCFQVYTPGIGGDTSSGQSFMVITKNSRIRAGSQLTGYPITPTLLVEKQG